MNAGNIIDEAKARAFPHIGPQKLPEGSLMKTLSSLDQDVVFTASQQSPHLLSTEASEVAITNTKNANGYSLNSALQYTLFWIRTEDDESIPVKVVTEEMSNNPTEHPAGFVEDSTFFPSDPQGEDWADSSDDRVYWDDEHHFVYRYIPEFTALASRSDALQSPNIARAYVVQALMVQILQMQAGTVPETTLQREVQREKALRSQLQHQMDRYSRPQSSPTDRTGPTVRTLKDRRR